MSGHNGQDGHSRRGRGQGRRRHHHNRSERGAAGLHTEAHSGHTMKPSPDKPQSLLTEAVPEDTPLFSDLASLNIVHPTLLETITKDLKFQHMMPVQASTIHELLPPSRSDCLVQAKTGTGKTIAFLLPALQYMINHRSSDGISLLCISPTRELAMQIAKEATMLLQRMPQYTVRVAMGGTNKDREEKQILQRCDVLIATPGRLLDHMSNEKIMYAFRQVDTLVLDEADRLLDMGFMKDLRQIIQRLPDKKKTNRQGMLFSATIAPHVQQVASLVCSDDYKFISTIPAGEINTHERVPQFLIQVSNFASVAPAMIGAIRQEAAQTSNFKAIVFAPTAALASFYGHLLSNITGLPPVSVLHSRLSQNRRTKITDEYRSASSGILVATDVIARGMDFPGVTTVFQVGIPSDKESYVHRLGRTARASAEGRGFFIVAQSEEWFPKWTLKDINFIPRDPDLTSAGDVEIIATRMEEEEKAKIYQAWLGYYKNHLKALKWTTEQLVAQGNMYARDSLGSPQTPPIYKSTAGKMGLRGVKGLVIIPGPPKAPRGGNAKEGRRGGAKPSA